MYEVFHLLHMCAAPFQLLYCPQMIFLLPCSTRERAAPSYRDTEHIDHAPAGTTFAPTP